jgi:PAS domain S-box-containing protein
MLTRSLALSLGILCALAIASATALSIVAQVAAFRGGESGTGVMALAPWIVAALGALGATLAIALALLLLRRLSTGVASEPAPRRAERPAEAQPTGTVAGTAADMTSLKAAQNHVQETEARLEAVVRSAMDAIITIDSDQRIVLFNAAAESMFGCQASEAVGQALERFIPERFRGAHRAHVERFSQTGETSRRMGVQTALWALRMDGTEFPIEASISHATVRGQMLLTVILRDVTERAAAEQEIRSAHRELRELSVAMLEVRELERTRIARELHDELGQALTALKMDVEMLGAALPAARTDLIEQTATMRQLLDTTVGTTRRISSDLRPLVLDHLGLEAAAQWLAQNFSQRSGVPCDLSVDPTCSTLGEPHASALFRIMQESLTNVAKHAGAGRVEVRLDRQGPDAVLVISDDGVGMEREARAKPRSFGLRGISERVLLLEGQLEVASAPGAGTTLRVRIPLPAGSRQGAA